MHHSDTWNIRYIHPLDIKLGTSYRIAYENNVLTVANVRNFAYKKKVYLIVTPQFFFYFQISDSELN